MEYLVYLIYPLIAVALFWGSKLCGPKKWNDEFLSLKQTKALQGFCAICIMLHHCSQKTASPDLKEKYIIHGLDPFVFIGYFFVAIFLFCSGYGMFKSFKTKERYLRGFAKKKILPVVFALIISSFFFAFARVRCKETLWFTHPFNLGGPNTFNPYAWYVYAFIVFNIAFYIAFNYIKKENLAIFVTTIGVVAYMWFCDFWMYGNWWINTSLLFVIGMLVAKNEEKLIPHIKKYYLIYLPIFIILTVVCYAFGQYGAELLKKLFDTENYTAIRFTKLFGQICAAIFFTFSVFLIGMKVKIGNKFLAFMGSITLEFYLLHGLFVQMFGYAFLDECFEPVYYIKNVFIYVLVVFVLGAALAAFFHWADKYAIDWLDRKDYIDLICVGAKKLILFLIPCFIILTVFRTIQSHNQTKLIAENVTKYQDEFITYADVDGKKMAAYITGEGNHTIILLQDMGDYVPTMSLRGLADDLSPDYKVVVLDYFGYGFSDDTDKPRTNEAFADEIHAALTDLNIEGPYILAPCGASGLYAYKFIELYPDEVEAYIGLNSTAPNKFSFEMENYSMKIEDVVRYYEKEASFGRRGAKLLNATGYVRYTNPIYTDNFTTDRSEKDMEVMEEIIIKRAYSLPVQNEIKAQIENYNEMEGRLLPENLPAIFYLDTYTDQERFYYRTDWRQLYTETISNPDIQKYDSFDSGPGFMYYSAADLSRQIKVFVGRSLDGK